MRISATQKASSSSTMAEIAPYSNQTLNTDPSLQSLFHALDPISRLLHPNSFSRRPVAHRPATESFVMERGPRYRAYAEIRELKLRMKSLMRQESKENEKPEAPIKKQVKFPASSGGGRKNSSILTQSVPDFYSVIRKENRKPSALPRLPTMMEMTPPPPAKTFSKNSPILPSSRGSKSASAGEKRVGNNGGLMSRKSYANMEELKGLSFAASAAINGESRGGRSGKTIGKTVLSYRQF